MLHSNTERRFLADLALTRGVKIARCKAPAAVRARWQKSGFAPEDLHLFVRDDRRLIRRAEVLESDDSLPRQHEGAFRVCGLASLAFC